MLGPLVPFEADERGRAQVRLDLTREEYGWGTLLGDIAGGAAMGASAVTGATAAAATGLKALPGRILGAPTIAAEREAQAAARVGAGRTGQALAATTAAGATYGGIYGFNVETGDWVDKIKNSIVHAAGGAAAGVALHAGANTVARVSRPVRDAFRRWRQARTDVADEFNQAGVRLFAPALGGAMVRGAAEAGAGMVTGSSLRTGAREAIADLETQLNEALAAAGGPHTPATAGEAAQGFLRRNVAERSRPQAEVEALPDAS